MNEKQKYIISNGDIGQGENLVQAKMKQQQLKNSNYGNYSKQKRSSSKASSKNSSTTGSPYVNILLFRLRNNRRKPNIDSLINIKNIIKIKILLDGSNKFS